MFALAELVTRRALPTLSSHPMRAALQVCCKSCCLWFHVALPCLVWCSLPLGVANCALTLLFWLGTVVMLPAYVSMHDGASVKFFKLAKQLHNLHVLALDHA